MGTAVPFALQVHDVTWFHIPQNTLRAYISLLKSISFFIYLATTLKETVCVRAYISLLKSISFFIYLATTLKETVCVRAYISLLKSINFFIYLATTLKENVCDVRDDRLFLLQKLPDII
jgi:hypothetical protein